MKKFAAALIAVITITMNAAAVDITKDFFVINTTAVADEGLPVDPCWIYEWTLLSWDGSEMEDAASSIITKRDGLIIAVFLPKENSAVYFSKVGEEYIFEACCLKGDKTQEDFDREIDRSLVQIKKDLKESEVKADIQIQRTSVSVILTVKGGKDFRDLFLEDCLADL